MKSKKDRFKRLVSPVFDPNLDYHGYEGLPNMHVDIKFIPDIKLATDIFVSMVGGSYDFYGMDHNAVKLNDMTFEILEDPNDGYRSFLGGARIADKDSRYTFFRKPIATIRIESVEDMQETFEGYYFIDTEDNHLWCRIGTSLTDDYYPSFVCSYTPKKK